MPESNTTDVMTPEEFAKRMQGCDAIGDTEVAHAHADSILVEVLRSLGYSEGCDIFDNMPKWYA